MKWYFLQLCFIFLVFVVFFFLYGIVFKSFLAQRHWQTHTNKQTCTHTHALNYSFSCCWLILWLTNYPRRQQRRQQRWKQRNCCLFHSSHCFISGFRFPCACLLECERSSLRVPFNANCFSAPNRCLFSDRAAERE